MFRIKLLATVATAATIAFWVTHAIAQDKKLVRSQEYPGSIVHLVDWVMRSKGFCANEGLDCQSVSLANGPLAQQAAAAGSVDIIVSTLDVMMQAVAKGNDLIVVGPDINNNPYSLAASTDVTKTVVGKPYPENMKVLAGKRIGVAARGGSTEMIAKSLLAGAGIRPDSVIIVAVGPPATAYAALSAKQVDAILSWDPVPALCEATKTCVVLVDLTKGEGPRDLQAMNGGSVAYYARREYVERNLGTVDAFVRAHAQAVRWLQDPKNFAEAKEIASKHFKLGDDVPNRDVVFDKVVQRMIQGYGTHFNRKAVDAFNAFLTESKLIDKPLSATSIVHPKVP